MLIVEESRFMIMLKSNTVYSRYIKMTIWAPKKSEESLLAHKFTIYGAECILEMNNRKRQERV